MRLYVVTFRADTPKAGGWKTDHEVVLFAENSDEARKTAEDFFAQHGYWEPRYNPATMTTAPGAAPRFVSLQEVLTSSIFYNGHRFSRDSDGAWKKKDIS